MLASGLCPRLIINARSGTALGLAPDDLRRRAHEAFEAGGSRVDVHIAAPGDINRHIEEARRADQPVIIGGGDGTVRAAAERLVVSRRLAQ